MQNTFIIGGQKSGKTAYAEMLAKQWLQQGGNYQAIYCATAIALDDEMRARIMQHQQKRKQRVPTMRTVELANLPQTDLAVWLSTQNNPKTAVVLDCLSMWLAHIYTPLNSVSPQSVQQRIDSLLLAIQNCKSQLYIVGNEIGLGVIPMGTETRAFVDTLGYLNQQITALCTKVVFICAGLPLVLKQ